jgi:DNA-directed RNA polymerase subunit beta
VRDASLKVPPGIEGTVVDVKIFSRKGVEKDERAKEIEAAEVYRLEKNIKDEVRILTEERNKKITDSLQGQTVRSALTSRTGDKLLAAKGKITYDLLDRLTRQEILRLPLTDKKLVKEVEGLYRRTDSHIEVLHRVNEERIALLQKGDELPPGVIKLVKVYVAMKRKLQVGDKMAGRHGNKGVISRVLPEEDMPYLPDGTPVDIVLNPLGVPSRMNVGQILETYLGWAGKELGVHYATPVFDGAKEQDMNLEIAAAGLPPSGKTDLIDGMTGVPFEQKVTVGYIYILKLSHLVDDKIHARSIGPYSLITQQPLGGKAQFGGQRFGEMEVWALEAYGAAYTLQELLTVKSDDVEGRSKVYEAIVKGEIPEDPGLPESFNVLVRELQSLCLDIELLKA